MPMTMWPPSSLSPVSGLITTEAGGTATFTIRLAAEPSVPVMVGLVSANATEGMVSPAVLTFTPANWNVVQAVSVTGVDDTVADGSRAYLVITQPAAGGDPAYDGMDAADVRLTNADDDSAGITVSPTGSVITSEAGRTATFSVVLNTAPASSVAIGLSSSNTGEVSVSVTGLVFTPLDWSVPQTVTLTGVDDLLADGSQPFLVVTAPASSADPLYSGLDGANVVGANVDNESAGVTVTPVGGLTTSEAGGSATFAIVLNTQPTAGVLVSLASSDTTEGLSRNRPPLSPRPTGTSHSSSRSPASTMERRTARRPIRSSRAPP